MRRRTLVAAALGAVAILAAAGCGTGGLGNPKADKVRGKELFSAKCAACHTLADAGATGISGPNLDDSFREVRKQGFKESTIFEVIDKQILYPTPRDLADPKQDIHVNGPLPTVEMPADLVTGSDRDAVASYVASVAGLPVKPGSGTSGGGGGGVAAKDGKSIFTSAGCASCHTLKDAGATGTIGPNLDQLKPPKPLVVDRVTHGKGVMPSFKGKLSPAQIQAVADYVASVAGK